MWCMCRRHGVKCAGCCRVISPRELVRRPVGDVVYHVDCFVCVVCGRQLGTGDALYALPDGRLVCRHDWLQGAAPGTVIDQDATDGMCLRTLFIHFSVYRHMSHGEGQRARATPQRANIMLTAVGCSSYRDRDTALAGTVLVYAPAKAVHCPRRLSDRTGPGRTGYLSDNVSIRLPYKYSVPFYRYLLLVNSGMKLDTSFPFKHLV